ncbi:MFS transporter [Nocardia australiensis]|uniref:MFS transporter n=1 Tax=Nocardia australiensis TaxID=2887191 RepID=UPI001D15C52B|nr:MFS transporter [Nocardia australiensis]
MTISSSPTTTGASPMVSSPAALIGVILVASFMDLLDVTIVAVAAPDIQSSLGASPAQLQWMVAAYALSLGAALITGGQIGDQYGRRRAFLIGLAGFIAASAACALAPTAGALIALRVVQGLASGLMVPQVFGIIRASLTPRQMGAALGAYGGVQGLASIAGPLLGGILVTADLFDLGWRTIFWVNVPVGLIALLIGWKVLRESRRDDAGRLDLVGAALLAGSLLLVLLPIVQGQSWGWPGWGWALLTAGVAGLAVFGGVERRIAAAGGQPIFDPQLLRSRAFSSGLVASLAFFGGIASFFLLLSIYLQDGTGRTALATGLITLPYALGSMITSGVGVKLAARHGRRLLITGSLLIAASHAAMWLVVIGLDSPAWWQLGGPLLVGGLGLGLAAPPLVNVILAGVPARAAGSAGGVLSMTNQIGGSISVAALGTLFFTHLTDAAPTGSGSASGFSDAFAAILPWQIGLYLVAAALMTLLPATSQSTEPHPAEAGAADAQR